jgi:hypothetical protein
MTQDGFYPSLNSLMSKYHKLKLTHIFKFFMIFLSLWAVLFSIIYNSWLLIEI